MIKFHDFDPAHPFDVDGEKHIVTGGKITLNYAPLKGSVSIDGYSENITKVLASAAFYIDYDEENNYRSANQIVYFSPDAEGKEVKVSYKGVSTLLRAKHLNEIKDYMERGAPEMVANMLIAHESALIGYFDNRIDGLTAAINEVRDSVSSVAAALGGLGGGTTNFDFATDSEVDEVFKQYFGDSVDTVEVEPIFDSPVDDEDFATDDEVDDVLDKYFGGKENGE